MKKFFLIILIFLFNCNNKTNNYQSIESLNNISGKKISIKITKSRHWAQPFTIGLYSGVAIPQIAVWLEDEKGNYLETLYVTGKFAKQNWQGAADQEPGKTFRISSLPYWMNKRIKAGFQPPTQNSPIPDTITSASPKGSFILNTKIKKFSKKLFLLVEVNNSFDKNDNFKTLTGQPAIVYKKYLDINNPGNYKMDLSGYSSEDGKNGKLYTDLNKITTAKNIIENPVIIIK